MILSIPTYFIVVQPDLGTAITVILLGILILFYAGVRLWKFLIGFFCGNLGESF